MSHMLDAIINNVASYGAACAAHTEHYYNGSQMNSPDAGEDCITLCQEIGSLEGQLTTEQGKRDALHHNYDKVYADNVCLRTE